MARETRQIVRIDEELCNGCGECVPSCKEGAIEIIDGKARLVSETYCDGLGACLGECPRGAITIETREAESFDEHAVAEHLHQLPAHQERAGHVHHDGTVCPSARAIDRTGQAVCEPSPTGHVASELRTWPVKLYLVNPGAPYFNNADLLIASDCVPVAFGGFHGEMLRGKVVVTGCPKFDDTDLYLEKLTQILKENDVRSVTVAQMEVPCCAGMAHVARLAAQNCGKSIPVETVTISLEGEII